MDPNLTQLNAKQTSLVRPQGVKSRPVDVQNNVGQLSKQMENLKTYSNLTPVYRTIQEYDTPDFGSMQPFERKPYIENPLPKAATGGSHPYFMRPKLS